MLSSVEEEGGENLELGNEADPLTASQSTKWGRFHLSKGEGCSDCH